MGTDPADLTRHLDALEPREILYSAEQEVEEYDQLQTERVLLRTRRVTQERWKDLEEEIKSSRQRLVQALVERALLPEVRRYVNQFQANLESNELGNTPGTGLHHMLPDSFELRTSAVSAVENLLRQPSAAVGISGPRGSGKTTLIEWFCKARGRQRRRHNRPWASTLVAAPVQYDARDFLLHIFAELCTMEIGGGRRKRRLRLEGPRRATVAITSSVYNLALRVLLVLLGLAGVYLLWSLLAQHYTVPVATQTIRQFFSLLTSAWIVVNIGLVVKASIVHQGHFFSMLNHLKRPERPLFLLSALLAGGAGFLLVGQLRYRIVIADEQVVNGAGGLSAVIATLFVWRLITWQVARRSDVAGDPTEALNSAAVGLGPLQAQAESYLDEIRFQQSFTSGWAGKVNAGTKVLGAELSSTEGITLARTAWTLPETVRNLRGFMEAIGRAESGFILGIDEIDKIADLDEARRFVNDLKAIFQVPRCYFLVSVSDDAVANFERRGITFRDDFDSAFDEIVRVEYATVDESRRILLARVVGLPLVFSSLCHVLSGGLPRDLLRTTRYLYSLPRPIGLVQAVSSMLHRELLSRVPVLFISSAKLDAVTMSLVIEWSEQVRNAEVSLLRGHVSALRDIVERVGQDQSFEKSAKAYVMRTCQEAEVVVLLACTIYEYCVEIDESSIPASRSTKLASLAAVRQDISLHPARAAVHITDFRKSAGMDSIETWTLSPDEGQVL